MFVMNKSEIIVMLSLLFPTDIITSKARNMLQNTSSQKTSWRWQNKNIAATRIKERNDYTDKDMASHFLSTTLDYRQSKH